MPLISDGGILGQLKSLLGGFFNLFAQGGASGGVAIRQKGAAAGTTSELRISHNGTDVSYSNPAGGASNSAHNFGQPIQVTGQISTNASLVGTNCNITSFGGFLGVNGNSRMVVNNGYAQFFQDQANPAVTPAQITSNQNDYAPGNGEFQRWSSDASRNVTGMTSGQDGLVREIWNVGAQNIVIQHENAGSASANRFTSSTGADLTLLPGKAARTRYDATTSRHRIYLFN